jgi:hypothetical protein
MNFILLLNVLKVLRILKLLRFGRSLKEFFLIYLKRSLVSKILKLKLILLWNVLMMFLIESIIKTLEIWNLMVLLMVFGQTLQPPVEKELWKGAERLLYLLLNLRLQKFKMLLIQLRMVMQMLQLNLLRKLLLVVGLDLVLVPIVILKLLKY